MPILIDESQVEEASFRMMEVFEEQEVDPLEAIAALIRCVVAMAEKTDDPDTTLDWAVRRIDEEQ